MHVLCLKGKGATRTTKGAGQDLESMVWGGGGEDLGKVFLRFYKMPCKSVFLLQMKYIEKFKLL